jgi:hypothetical protein
MFFLLFVPARFSLFIFFFIIYLFRFVSKCFYFAKSVVSRYARNAVYVEKRVLGFNEACYIKHAATKLSPSSSRALTNPAQLSSYLCINNKLVVGFDLNKTKLFFFNFNYCPLGRIFCNKILGYINEPPSFLEIITQYIFCISRKNNR